MATPYHILIAPKAERSLHLLTTKQQKLILRLIEALAINPRPPGAKKIEGMVGLYHEEVGQFRVIYKIEEQEVLVLLVK